MIDPIEKEIDGKVFIISKFPAVAGREIVSQYPLSALPGKAGGDYKLNETIMLKLMSYVAVPVAGSNPIKLSNQTLIDNHVTSWETLAKIEMAMMEYNCSFFQDGRISGFLKDTAQNIPAWISKTLTALSVQSSQADKQPSSN